MKLEKTMSKTEMVKAILDAAAASTDTPMQIHKDLASRSYSDAFPGSFEARVANAYYEAQGQFDAAHPEVVAAVAARDEAEAKADHAAAEELGWI